jgi:hypothetical protein
MNTRSEHYTDQILEYFRGKPEGHYAPYDVRMDLGISSQSWRWFATRHLYPEGSDVRGKLSAIGVEIETTMQPARPECAKASYPASSFVVAGGNGQG